MLAILEGHQPWHGCRLFSEITLVHAQLSLGTLAIDRDPRLSHGDVHLRSWESLMGGPELGDWGISQAPPRAEN